MLCSGSFIKRERVKDGEVLVSRLVDRPLRPMFQQGWSNETQVGLRAAGVGVLIRFGAFVQRPCQMVIPIVGALLAIRT